MRWFFIILLLFLMTACKWTIIFGDYKPACDAAHWGQMYEDEQCICYGTTFCQWQKVR